MNDIITIVSGILSIIASILSITAISKVYSIDKKVNKFKARGENIHQSGGDMTVYNEKDN